jgi:hypothetical protein
MKRMALIFMVSWAQQVLAQIGFQSGNQFTVHNIYGEIQIRCQTPTESITTTYDCNESTLLPSELDIFIGPRGTMANEVTLYNAQDPRTRRTTAYNAHLGQSASTINLWLRSLLQRPLLSFGVNRIEFELTNGGTLVTKGNFNVSVTRGEAFTCSKTGSFQSNLADDCRNPQRFCSDFFKSQNYCYPF